VKRLLDTDSLTLRLLQGDTEARVCAELMATSDPWITFGRSYEQCLAVVRDPSREVYIAVQEQEVVGFAVLCMAGAFVGYVQTLCVRADRRGHGLGRMLLAFAEERIFRERPNVFMCVSSFNIDAQRLYRRLGYEVVGELTDYIVAGHSEILLRKSVGPLSVWRPPEEKADTAG
jgi:ribosomal protein S18 acetylase RimI-like enzyme